MNKSDRIIRRIVAMADVANLEDLDQFLEGELSGVDADGKHVQLVGRDGIFN